MPTVTQRIKRLFSREKTGSQNVFRTVYGTAGFGIPRLETGDEFNKKRRTDWASLVRKMQCEPTIAMLQMLYVSQVVSPGFSIDADDDVPEKIVKEERARTKDLFEPFARAATMGLINWGWSTFENVSGDDGTGQLEIKKLKSLLHDLTSIEIYEDTGDVAGVSQGTTKLWKDEAECVVLSWNVEGSNWYGRALMKSLEIPYLQKLRIEKRAEEFDGRVAAAHWVVYYPPGNDSIEYGEDGQPIATSGKDNQEVALEILTALLDTGSAVIPSEVMSRINELNDGSSMPKEKSAWRIELLKSVESGGTSPYQDRLKYKDVEFARGLGFLERSVFEGQTGTRADAEQHTENSALGPRDMANYLAKELTSQVVDHVVETNHGEEYKGKIRVIANPLTDAELDRLQKLYDKLLSNGDILLSEYDSLDIDYISDKLNVPRNKASDETDLDKMDLDDLELAENLSCVMLKLPENGCRIVHAMQNQIPFADLSSDGKVDDPHVTVRYGLHEENSRPIFEAMKVFGPVTITIGEPKVFKKDDADIVVLSVESPMLRSLHVYLGALFDHTDTFSEYSPHVTVAYVRSGLGESYAKKFDGLTGQEFVLNELIFSDPMKWKDETKLEGVLVLSESAEST